MATTVIAAFNEFMKDTVNLKKADTDDARASRDWLIGKMNDFEKDDKFPVSFPAIHIGFAPIFPDICYHLTHYKPAAADIPVASDNPAHYADAIRYNARTPLQGSLLPLTRLVWA